MIEEYNHINILNDYEQVRCSLFNLLKCLVNFKINLNLDADKIHAFNIYLHTYRSKYLSNVKNNINIALSLRICIMDLAFHPNMSKAIKKVTLSYG